MARRKGRRDRDRPERRRRPAPAPDDLPEIPDRRLVEARLWEFAGDLGGTDSNSPLARAQALVYQAVEERDEQRRVALARQALAVCPDCADAYVLLAEHAPSRREARELYEQGVAAGERALGPDRFREHAGHFWGVLETRPYMRARFGLADELWAAARRDEAVAHLQDMLRLNPNDNQGVRYLLAGWLLALGRDDDLARLLEQFADECTASWAYTGALLEFRRHGDTPEARRLLGEAQQLNRHVPDYLLGRKVPPLAAPGSYILGDESEALVYLRAHLAGWKATPGAVAWVRANDELTKKRKAENPHPKGPLAFIKKWLREHLPQEDDVWQAGAFQPPNWISIAGEKLRPWTALVLSHTHDLALATLIVEDDPEAGHLWDTLVKAMQHPAAGEPHRPTRVEARPDERWEALRPHLQEIGVELLTTGQLSHFDALARSLGEGLAGPPLPGLLDMPGITPEQVASFYEAAAEFYRKAPWQRLGWEAAIRVACDKFHGGPWYPVVMGQSGLTLGLAIYEDLDVIRRTWASRAGEEPVEDTIGVSLTYGEETDIPVAELEAVRRHGWTVAGPEAYPCVFHKNPGMSSRLPLAWELELLEACLRTVPDFIARRPLDDPTPEHTTVPLASGPLAVVLSWVADEEGLTTPGDANDAGR